MLNAKVFVYHSFEQMWSLHKAFWTLNCFLFIFLYFISTSTLPTKTHLVVVSQMTQKHIKMVFHHCSTHFKLNLNFKQCKYARIKLTIEELYMVGFTVISEKYWTEWEQNTRKRTLFIDQDNRMMTKIIKNKIKPYSHEHWYLQLFCIIYKCIKNCLHFEGWHNCTHKNITTKVTVVEKNLWTIKIAI